MTHEYFDKITRYNAINPNVSKTAFESINDVVCSMSLPALTEYNKHVQLYGGDRRMTRAEMEFRENCDEEKTKTDVQTLSFAPIISHVWNVYVFMLFWNSARNA